MAKILVIDNYDSFVYNIIDYLAQLGADVEVWRNDDPRLDGDLAQQFDGLVLSPGPGTPELAGRSVEVVQRFGKQLPIFGVCLGLQSIAVAYGATVNRAPELLHGKTTMVSHDGEGVFQNVPNPFQATRYHSLAVSQDDLPADLTVSCWTDSGVIMAIRHREDPVEAVQFHPESVLTEHGHKMLANWLVRCGDEDAWQRAEGKSAKFLSD